MSVADLYDLELIWPSSEPTEVIVTGTFDQWSSSIYLVKGDDVFSGSVKVPWGQKIAYKFIVDGHWECLDDRPQEEDGDGNINNVFQAPEKPEPVAIPARLSIPPAGVPSEGYSAIENMVTAVEFIPPAEPAATRVSLPLPIPQISTEGLSQGPSPVNEPKLNTAAATEGNISPASVTLAEVASPSQAPSSQLVSVLPLSDNDSFPLPAIIGNGGASEGIMTHAPIQFTKGELPTRLVPENEQQVVTTPEPAVLQSAAQPDDPPAATVDPSEKQPEVGPPQTASQVQHEQTVAPPSNVPTPSTPASSTLTQKKRRSFLARIKDMFEKNKNKRERKEKAKN